VLNERDQADNIGTVGESFNRFLAPPRIPGCNRNQISPSTPPARHRRFLTSKKRVPPIDGFLFNALPVVIALILQHERFVLQAVEFVREDKEAEKRG
jgi:hypothetical protein